MELRFRGFKLVEAVNLWVRLMEQQLENFEEEHRMVEEVLRRWEMDACLENPA